jgi:hypothetical protein
MLQMLDGAGHLDQKLLGHFAREAMTDENALDNEVLAIGGHGIRGNQPAALAQPIRNVIESERKG